MPNYSGIWTEQAVMQAVGAGNWPNAPGAPTIGTATNTGAGGTVSVAFTAPTFAGLPANITSYTVTSSPGGLTGTGASSPITVSGLTNGTAYTFTVTATNASGTGPASAASNSVTPIQLNYVEEVFSTTLYVGNGTTQTVTNGIDLSTKGGLVWLKNRTANSAYTESHGWFDTARGAYYGLNSNGTAASTNYADMGVSAFNTDGFDTKNRANPGAGWNNTNIGYTSWTFREQAKFFDIVTWTGNGTGDREISHNLGSAPGCIILKCTSSGGTNWFVYHRSLSTPNQAYLYLNDTSGALSSGSNLWNVTSTTFRASSVFDANNTGATYIAYLWAHDAGGFGASGTDNVISCGSFTADGSGGCSVTLGYEPQWIMYKNTAADGWRMEDTMRGWSQSELKYLTPNDTSQEGDLSNSPSYLAPTSTGFNSPTPGLFTAGNTFVYIAIRRGPMKVPTNATTVFEPNTTSNGTLISSVPVKDAVLNFTLTATAGWQMVDRLRGILNGFTANTSGNTTTNRYLITNSTAAESASGCRIGGLGIARSIATAGTWYNGDTTVIANGNFDTAYFFQRAPSFFDVVCYSGLPIDPGTIYHNLGVPPELIIVKRRNASATLWPVYAAPLGVNTYAVLNSDSAVTSPFGYWGGTTPTSTYFNITQSSNTFESGGTFVAYLFATCPGVSKVGGYTGTGVDGLQIDCGFTAGARFILIKRTDSANDWHVWDSARGIVAGADPYLKLNTAGAQVAGDDIVDTYSAGFIVNAFNGVNANGGTYIFLAIA